MIDIFSAVREALIKVWEEYGPHLPLRIVGGRKWFAPIEDEL